MGTSTKDVVLFAPMGSNPALLVSMAWALHRDGLRVVAATVVVADKGQRYVDEELLPEGGALSQLHEVLGPEVLPKNKLRVVPAKLPDGGAVEDPLIGEHEAAYRDTVAGEAGLAIARAGDRPLVFALIGGRRRSMTIMAGVVAQLLARPGDQVFDLHIDPRGADVPNRFFFPEQRNQEPLAVGETMLKPSDVEVRAVPVEVPRLATLFSGTPPKLYPELLKVAQKAIDEAKPIRLEIRLAKGSRGAFVREMSTGNVEQIAMSPSVLLFIASLVEARNVEPNGYVPIPDTEDQNSYFAKMVRKVPWAFECRSLAVKWFLQNSPEKPAPEDGLDSLKTLRHDAKRAMTGYTKGRHPCYRSLELESTNDTPAHWRIPLEDVEIVD